MSNLIGSRDSSDC